MFGIGVPELVLIALVALVVAPAGPAQAAQGLFTINLCMLFTFLAWGAVMPRLARRRDCGLCLLGTDSGPGFAFGRRAGPGRLRLGNGDGRGQCRHGQQDAMADDAMRHARPPC